MVPKPCAALAASLLLIFYRPAQAQTLHEGGNPLYVYLMNGEATTPVTLETLRGEVEELLQPSNIPLSWHDGQGSVNGRLAVIRIQGSCHAEAPLPLALTNAGHEDPEALGKTHVSNGVVLPFADIRCEELRRFIQSSLRSANNAEAREQMLGRALARVIAHELYHILLRTRAHGKSGIARATQTAAQLIAPRRSFSKVDERKLSTGEPVTEETPAAGVIETGRH
jgi:hypothetical protein